MDPTPELDERERQILHAVVHTYITTAEPVGSRSVVRRFGLNLSPATVRNVMADLEEAGYLQQLHTSSGRVPTDVGYRYYVNHLMHVQELTLGERERIEREYTSKLNDADDVLRQTSHLLALVTHQAGIAEAPSEDKAQVNRIELLPISAERAAILIVDNFGRVRSMTVQVKTRLSDDDFPVLNRFLNEHLRGITIEDLALSVSRKLQTFLDEQRALAERALSVLSLMPTPRPGQLFLDGATQLFEQPEFQDVEKAREVFGLFEEHERLIQLLRMATRESATARRPVLIGVSETDTGVQGISVVASPYEVDGKPVGAIGVLGPRRMPYSRLMSIVDYTAGMVGRLLTRFGG